MDYDSSGRDECQRYNRAGTCRKVLKVTDRNYGKADFPL
jgi:uncharacterized protein YodC (DUF2158 family)